jgi:hypothetical protein
MPSPSYSNKSVNVGGSIYGNNVIGGISNSVINSGAVNSSEIEPEKLQLKRDLRSIEELMNSLVAMNPQASLSEQKMFLTAGTPMSTKRRLVEAKMSGGEASIAEFLDPPIAKIVVTAIDDWKS